MPSYRISLCPPAVCLVWAGLLAWCFLSPALAQMPGPAGSYLEDYNGDGKVSISDVIALLLLSREDPQDPRVDYNGDGKFSISDAIALLINIRDGNLHPLEEPAADHWQVIGPGGGGAMFVPAVDPFDPAHYFVVCDMTGAYVTFDDGVSWRMFNLRTRVQDIEFDPTSQGTVYAANTGLYRSEDGGVRWRLVYPDPSQIISEQMVGDHAEQWYETTDGMPDAEIDKIRVDPADGDHLYLGLHPRWDGPARLLVSSDRGADWRVVCSLEGGSVLAIFPGSWWDNPDKVTVVTEEACLRISESSGEVTSLELPAAPLLCADGGRGEEGAAVYILSGMWWSGKDLLGGVYRSDDGCSSWTPVSAGLVKGISSTMDAPSFNVLAACRNRPEIVYLSCESTPATSDVPYYYGIYKTTDKGETWSWALKADWNSYVSNNYSESWLTRSYGTGYSGSPNGLGVCPTDPDVCLASDGHSFRTADGGETWQTVYSNDMGGGAYSSRGLDVTTCYGVHFDP
ncbi:MAG: hypothetical protein JXQ83_09725, partial [Candidatus Glassbacteria bacterium]|nr:hypothetical protein [Candidatus Glassbacteria bacterium]